MIKFVLNVLPFVKQTESMRSRRCGSTGEAIPRSGTEIPEVTRKTLESVRGELGSTWFLCRQAALHSADRGFAYSVTLLYLRAYLRYCLHRGCSAIGSTAGTTHGVENLSNSLREIKRQSLVKIILMAPGSVILIREKVSNNVPTGDRRRGWRLPSRNGDSLRLPVVPLAAKT